MSSTRRTQDRFGASFRKPAAAAVEAAEVAEAAEAAEAAAAEAAAAVGIGELAAFARPDCFPITLTTQIIMAGFDEVGPANPCIVCNGARLRASAGPHM